MPPPVATQLILGATGAGKTTLIRGLLALKPAHERWAVLTNDFGSTRVDTLAARGEVVLREVNGCACCIGQVTLRAALVRMLREARPARLLIEASAAAMPQALFALLEEPGIAPAIRLHSSVCVVDAAQLMEPRFFTREDYRAQIATAGRVVINLRGGREATRIDAAQKTLAEIRGPGLVIETSDGTVPIADL